MRNTSRFVATAAAAAGTLATTVVAAVWFGADGVWFLLLNAAVCFAVLYGLVYTLVIRYVSERLKSVYRVMNIDKQNGKPGAPTSDELRKVDALVEAWQQERNAEIERLRSNDVYRKEFVANVTHELKTPLFNIQGYVHSLLDGALEDREVNRMFLEKAARNVERLATLVSDLEAVTQLETGGVVFEPEVFDLAVLVKDVFESLEIKARSKNKALAFAPGATVSNVYAYADKDKIRQVLVNLIENSIKYGIPQGHTWVNLIPDESNVLIEVMDDGPGIPAEHLTRLFERFYRVDKSRSREAGGTGLGLAIAKHIVEGHGKTISVQSTVGKGTTFRFALEKR